MTQRKFREVTRGGYWVRNIRYVGGSYPIRAEVSRQKSNEPISDDRRLWLEHSFTDEGRFYYREENGMDLIEVTNDPT